jgi:hypothetical protein
MDDSRDSGNILHKTHYTNKYQNKHQNKDNLKDLQRRRHHKTI